MASYGLLLSRLVPWLLVASGVLILARFLSDRLAPRAPGLARSLFFASLLVFGLASLLYFARAGFEVLASMAYADERWSGVDRSYARLTRLGGHPSPAMGREWAIARMHLGEWDGCERVLLETARTTARGPALTPDAVLLIGQCAYYGGDLPRAKAALTAARKARLGYVRSFLLGQIAESERDFAAALGWYGQARRENPRFFPALYHQARLLIAAGDRESAARELAGYQRIDPAITQTAMWKALVEAIQHQGAPPPAIRFHVFES